MKSQEIVDEIAKSERINKIECDHCIVCKQTKKINTKGKKEDRVLFISEFSVAWVRRWGRITVSKHVKLMECHKLSLIDSTTAEIVFPEFSIRFSDEMAQQIIFTLNQHLITIFTKNEFDPTGINFSAEKKCVRKSTAFLHRLRYLAFHMDYLQKPLYQTFLQSINEWLVPRLQQIEKSHIPGDVLLEKAREIHSAYVPLLLDSLHVCKNVHKIRFPPLGIRRSPMIWGPLAHYLHNETDLRMLEFRDIPTAESADFEEFTKALVESPLSKVVSVHFHGREMNSEFVKRLEVLGRSSTLKLILTQGLTPDGYEMLCTILENEPGFRNFDTVELGLFNASSHLTRLVHTNIRRLSLITCPDIDVTDVLNAIETSELVEIRLTGMECKGEIKEGVVAPKSLNIVCLTRIAMETNAVIKYIENSPTVDQVIMMGCFKENDPMVPAITHMLQGNNHIRALSLKGFKDCYELGASLEPIIRTAATSPSLETLNISDNAAGNDVLLWLEFLLSENSAMKMISFDGNKISDGECLLNFVVALEKLQRIIIIDRLDITLQEMVSNHKCTQAQWKIIRSKIMNLTKDPSARGKKPLKQAPVPTATRDAAPATTRVAAPAPTRDAVPAPTRDPAPAPTRVAARASRSSPSFRVPAVIPEPPAYTPVSPAVLEQEIVEVEQATWDNVDVEFLQPIFIEKPLSHEKQPCDDSNDEEWAEACEIQMNCDDLVIDSMKHMTNLMIRAARLP